MATFNGFAGPNLSAFEGALVMLYPAGTVPVPMAEGYLLAIYGGVAASVPEYEGAFYTPRGGMFQPAPPFDATAYHRREGVTGRSGIPPEYYISTKRGSVLEVLQNTARNIYVFMRALDTGAGLAGLAPTMTILASKNGAAGVAITPTVTDLAGSLGAGWYTLALTGPHLDTLGSMALHITALAALPNDDVLLNVIAIDKQDGVRAGLSVLPPNAFGALDGLPSAEQVANIGVAGAALNANAVSRVITTGTESGVLANTDTLDNVFHTFTDVAGVIDFYYEFDVSATLNATGVSAQWKGYLNGTNDSMKAYAWNWLSSAWDQLGIIPGSGDTVVYGLEMALTNSHTSGGIARIRFANTGLTSATFATDRILFGYTVTPSGPVAIANQVWDMTRAGHQVPGTFGEAIPNAAAGAVAGIPVVGTHVPSAALGAAGGLPIVGTTLPSASPGTNGGLPVVGTQVPNAAAGAVGGLPVLDANLDVGANVQHWTGLAPSNAVAAAVLDALLSNHTTVGSVADGVAVAMGLLQGNFFMDNVTNTANGQTAARIRIWRSAGAMGTPTPGAPGLEGAFAWFLVTTTYTGPNKIATHMVVRQ